MKAEIQSPWVAVEGPFPGTVAYAPVVLPLVSSWEDITDQRMAWCKVVSDQGRAMEKNASREFKRTTTCIVCADKQETIGTESKNADGFTTISIAEIPSACPYCGADPVSLLPENGVVGRAEVSETQLAECVKAGATVLWREDQHAKEGPERQAVLAKIEQLKADGIVKAIDTKGK